ncbi:MAG: hypothetical protein IJ071_09705 [Ruminococcus sp.]|nr:hypothetical protein [Ruminococcus sp.]
MKKSEHGAFAIDAVIGLTFFMLSILAIMFMSLIIRVQASMQYALDQTAKEISGYFYLLDKAGITDILSGKDPSGVDKKLEGFNTTVGNLVSLSNGAKDVSKNIDFDDGLSLDTIKDLKNEVDTEKIKGEISQVSKYIKDLSKDNNAADQLKAVIQVFGRTMINRGFSALAAPLVCQALMPKYMTSGDVDEFYEKMGVDPDSVSFQHSQLLFDGRSIKLVVEYELDTEKLTFGMIKHKMTFRQVAVTAAWIRPDGDTTLEISKIKLPQRTGEVEGSK